MSERWTGDLLDAMREIADPQADAVFAAAKESGGMQAVLELNLYLQSWGAPIPAHFDPRVREGLAEMIRPPESWPDWASQEEIDKARELFRQWGLETLLVMFMKSFPQFFADGPAAQVFYRADAISPASVKRFFIETVQLIFDVIREAKLLEVAENRRNLAIEGIQKLRLHHSFIRDSVVHGERAIANHGEWDPEWGKPINQEDLAAALLAFAVWNLDGLDELRIHLTDEERESTLMVWKIMGFLLGLDERLQPTDVDDARALLEAIGERQFARSTGGVAVVNQLLSTIQDFLPWFLRGMPVHLMRHLMEPKFVMMLDIPTRWVPTALVIRVLRAFRGDIDEIKARRKTTRHVARRLIGGVVKAHSVRQGIRGKFRIPQGLDNKLDSEHTARPSHVQTVLTAPLGAPDPGGDVKTTAGFAQIDGVATYYEEMGEGGTPIVFVHGWSLDRSFWRPQMEHFGKTRRVVGYDWRGHGHTLGRDSRFRFEQLVDDLMELIRTLDLGRPIIVGHSAGGVICVRAAVKYQNSISGLILLDTPDADTPSTGPLGFLAFRLGLRVTGVLLPSYPLSPFTGLFRKQFYSEEFIQTNPAMISDWQRQFLNNSPPAILHAIHAQSRIRPVTDQLSGVKVPMLGFWGTKDKACPREPMERYVRKIPNSSELHLVEGSGHMTLTEEPEVINRGIDKFLDTHGL